MKTPIALDRIADVCLNYRPKTKRTKTSRKHKKRKAAK